MKKLELKWKHRAPNLSENETEALEIGLNELEEALNYNASNLMFHAIFLEKDHNGASVNLWGVDEDEKTIHAEYLSKTKWANDDKFGADV